jgi:hypothetical protein
MKSLGFGLALGVIGLAGCGGNVVFSEDGEGGAGGSTITTTTNQGAGPNSSVTTTNQGGGPNSSVTTTNQGGGPNSSVVTGPISTCETLCNQFSQCLEDNCFDQCQQVYQPGCEAQAEAYLQCVINFLSPNCDFPDYDCSVESQQLDECFSGGSCVTEGCDTGGGSCSCSGNCGGNPVVASCFANGGPGGGQSSSSNGGGPPPPGGGFTCECFLNGEYFGTCDDSPMDVCNGIEQGCCAQVFL